MTEGFELHEYRCQFQSRGDLGQGRPLQGAAQAGRERATTSALNRQDEKLRKIAQSVELGYEASFRADWERPDFNDSPAGRGIQCDRGNGRVPE